MRVGTIKDEEKLYLVLGAVCDNILLDQMQVSIKVTGKQNLKNQAGAFESFVLSYNIGPKTSRICISQGMPLPVQEDVHDEEGELQYNYQLFNVQR